MNLTKRQLGAALTYNLSLLLRHLTGVGTPKQWLAGIGGLFAAIRSRFEPRGTYWRLVISLSERIWTKRSLARFDQVRPRISDAEIQIAYFSTGC